MSKIRALSVTAVVLLFGLSLVACTPATPEENVAQLRSRFEARVNGFYVEAVPQMIEPTFDDEGVEEGADVEAGSDEEDVAMGDEGGIATEVAVAQNAHLDLIIQHDNDEMLPGITIEIAMVGADQQEKGQWRLWVDTSELRKANQLQLVHVLEDVPYVEGDGFAAEVRSPIPPEERGDYQEFTSLGE